MTSASEVSVTRNAPGAVKRLSVAVLLRDPDKGRRTAMEIQQITDLVKSAVGFDPGAQDQVTVISRKFAGAADADADGPAWYDNAWLPMRRAQRTAIVIALLVLLLGVRPLAKALMKKRDDAAAARPRSVADRRRRRGGAGASPASRSASTSSRATRGYDDRIGAVRGFTRDNPARAALAVRDMIKADGQVTRRCPRAPTPASSAPRC